MQAQKEQVRQLRTLLDQARRANSSSTGSATEQPLLQPAGMMQLLSDSINRQVCLQQRLEQREMELQVLRSSSGAGAAVPAAAGAAAAAVAASNSGGGSANAALVRRLMSWGSANGSMGGSSSSGGRRRSTGTLAGREGAWGSGAGYQPAESESAAGQLLPTTAAAVAATAVEAAAADPVGSSTAAAAAGDECGSGSGNNSDATATAAVCRLWPAALLQEPDAEAGQAQVCVLSLRALQASSSSLA